MSGTKLKGDALAPIELKGDISKVTTLNGSIEAKSQLNCDIMYNTLKPIIDNELSPTSTNPVANKVIYEAFETFIPNIDNVNINVDIGSVETVNFDEGASVVNSGTGINAILDFKIPRGKDGNTPYIGSNGNWFIGEEDTGFLATSAELVEDVARILNLFDGNKFAHSITIGDHTYDGTSDVVIDIYKGEISESDLVSAFNLIQEELSSMTMINTPSDNMEISNSINTMIANENTNTMTANEGSNTMIANENTNIMTMNIN